ncbi:MAG: hypothetical protein WCW13_03565 [archaeon]|jgi:hypothetical protein
MVVIKRVPKFGAKLFMPPSSVRPRLSVFSNSRKGGPKRVRIQDGKVVGVPPALAPGHVYGDITRVTRNSGGQLVRVMRKGPGAAKFPRAIIIRDSKTGNIVGFRQVVEVK